MWICPETHRQGWTICLLSRRQATKFSTFHVFLHARRQNLSKLINFSPTLPCMGTGHKPFSQCCRSFHWKSGEKTVGADWAVRLISKVHGPIRPNRVLIFGWMTIASKIQIKKFQLNQPNCLKYLIYLFMSKKVNIEYQETQCYVFWQPSQCV